MKKIARFTLSFFFLALTTTINANNPISSLPFDKVVLWGHKLHSHTHSYIHWGFKRAFEHMGYKTYWLDNNDRIDMNLSNALFITTGLVDQKIPLRDDCFYILHNCTSDKYRNLYKKRRCITLQVYTHPVKERDVEKIDECMYYSVRDQIIYLPWATDLLPHEIDEIKKNITTRSLKEKSNTVNYIGSVGGGTIFSNLEEVRGFRKACEENNIAFKHIMGCSMEQNIAYIQASPLAPAIQSAWQCRNGYIPCRIFKNISYGQFGITNSETVYRLLKKKVVYNSNTHQLFYDAQKKLQNLDVNELYELMDLVKDNHTYINRINTLLAFFEMVYVSKQ